MVLPDTVRSTADEAREVARYRGRFGPTATIVVITAWDSRYDVRHSWRSKRGLMAVTIEGAKTLWHWTVA